jgi:hypothetical protein
MNAAHQSASEPQVAELSIMQLEMEIAYVVHKLDVVTSDRCSTRGATVD